MNKIGFLIIVSLLFPNLLRGQDIAQWRGPERNGIYPEVGLLDEWPEMGPEQIWSMEGIGKGVPSVSVKDGIIYNKKTGLDLMTTAEKITTTPTPQ